MSYVLLTSRHGFGAPSSEEAETLGWIDEWADHVDMSDGERSDPTDPTRGGRIRRVQMSGLTQHEIVSSPADRTRFIREYILSGYARAAGWAGPGGQIGVALGHGDASATSAWADLAPMGTLRVDSSLLENLWHWTQLAPEDRPPRPWEEEAVDLIGQILRADDRRLRVDRVDLYTCSVGQSPFGQDLLDWLHTLWRVPVRGLRGPLVISGALNPALPIYAYVMAPTPTRRGRTAFGRHFTDELIDGPGLWARSHDRRPPLSSTGYQQR